MKPPARASSLAWVALVVLGACSERTGKPDRGRSDAVSSASPEMSGASFFSSETLLPALQALRARGDGKLLRMEIRPHELMLQTEDSHNPGAVLELHYRDGRVQEPEHATLRGKGRLSDNLFELEQVPLSAIPQLAREAQRRVDADNGQVELVLVRRNLPDSEEVRIRVYVKSPLKDGHLDADQRGQPL